jgi:stage II sporulation protein D
MSIYSYRAQVVFIAWICLISTLFGAGRRPGSRRSPTRRITKRVISSTVPQPKAKQSTAQSIPAKQASRPPKITQPRRRALSQSRPSTFYVRVLLDERPSGVCGSWSFVAEGGYSIQEIHKSQRRYDSRSPLLTLATGGTTLRINGQQLMSSAVTITPRAGNIKHNQNEYKGSFSIFRKGGTWHLVNRIELEDYVASGLRWEMIPGWHPAALEAGAVAYRTYIIKALLEARVKAKKMASYKDKGYDIRCTPIHQTYKGTHTCSSIHTAVKNTKGLILTYDRRPIIALYDACCGGSIPAHRTGMDFEKAPYLARSYACHYCKNCKLYRWSHDYPVGELGKHLSSYTRRQGPLNDIKIGTKDKAGAVRDVKVKLHKSWVTVPAQKLSQFVKALKSPTFTAQKYGDMVRFQGGGLGHQYGLCQHGAQGMAKLQWNYKRILQFYYPGTTLAKAEGVFSHAGL